MAPLRHATLTPCVVELPAARHRGGCHRSSRRTRVEVWRRAMSGSRLDSSRVMRVRRVPSANASTFWRPATAAWTNRSNALAYGSIDPLTSSSSTSRRLRVVGSRQCRRIGSPPTCIAARTVRRRSGRRRPPLAAGQATRLGGATRRDAGGVISCCASIELLVGVVGEVLVPEHLGGAEAQLDRLLVGRFGGVGFVAGVVGGVVVDGERDVQRFLGRPSAPTV